MSADLFDFEIDALIVGGRIGIAPLSVGELAAIECEKRGRAGRKARRDDVYNAFGALLGQVSRCDFPTFRAAYIAEFRALGRECAGEPEQFFSKQVTCGCAQCAKAA